MIRLSIQARQALARLALPALVVLSFGVMRLGKADVRLAERARIALADGLAPGGAVRPVPAAIAPMAHTDRRPGIRPRQTVGRWLDVASRRSFPAGATVLLMLVAQAPFGVPGQSALLPSVAMCSVWFWSVSRAGSMPPPVVFLIGSLTDLLGYLPLGVGAFTLLAVQRRGPGTAPAAGATRLRGRLAGLCRPGARCVAGRVAARHAADLPPAGARPRAVPGGGRRCAAGTSSDASWRWGPPAISSSTSLSTSPW